MEPEIQYWQHDKSGEIYAVLPDVIAKCFGPLHYSEVGKITEDDDRWSVEDWEWLRAEPCHLKEVFNATRVGQSEENMERALNIIDAAAPVILFIDEIEKAMAKPKSAGAGPLKWD